MSKSCQLSSYRLLLRIWQALRRLVGLGDDIVSPHTYVCYSYMYVLGLQCSAVFWSRSLPIRSYATYYYMAFRYWSLGYIANCTQIVDFLLINLAFSCCHNSLAIIFTMVLFRRDIDFHDISEYFLDIWGFLACRNCLWDGMMYDFT